MTPFRSSSFFTPNLNFSYLVELNVIYIVLCDKTYPKKLAFTYLEEIQKEFQDKHGAEIDTVARPYALVKFGKY
jgi:vesicle transport protein SEC22